MLSARTRVLIDWALIISFAIVAITGIVLLLYPQGAHRGWRAAKAAATAWYTSSEILQLHIWSGIAFIVLCTVHLVINWNCLKNMTKACFK